MDAKTQFYMRMDRESNEASATPDDDTMDFLSESGRAVARMMRSDSVDQVPRAADLGLTEAEHDDLMRTLQQEEDDAGHSVVQNEASRPIPVPSTASLPIQTAQPLAGSHGSSGSAFLSSVLNPTASTFNNTQLSHTPPMASSYEVSHFGKRARSGSVSGRLRSASEYLEQRGLLDRHTKGLLKDLIIIGDEELQQAIDAYEMGDASKLEEMISSGALQNRLPTDIDILGDLDLDFLTMNESEIPAGGNIESLHHDSVANPPMHSSEAMATGSSRNNNDDDDGKYQAHSLGQPHIVPSQYSGHDDGIGDLEFAGDLVSDQTEYLSLQPPQPAYNGQQQQGQEPTIAAASPNESTLSEMEQRMRSNSLFSALLNDPRAQPDRVASLHSNPPAAASNASQHQKQQQQYGSWMDRNTIPEAKKPTKKKQQQQRRSSAPSSGIAASLEAAERKRLEKQIKKEKREKAKQEKKERKEREKRMELEEEEEHLHIPGSGRPRSLSDPNLRATLDSHGLQEVERPDGWVGAYSPDSRRVRIERFMEKRNHRVWTKTVKYDVRKNFADSRLRVKGRFVKKEDEVLMRELMSLT